ncbi:MATE family efflux transporter [Actinoplanes sp. NEAU-A12]|uniref:Probable multidrug resistance protein NorM n=1 Tax=Actinoplanes sandaracinus TaxID=3045177 RepID=A0ABT6WYM4_9ACTN|nr:MATE family efflux transporter [Actinoplanes sandaracinus]MDI6104836.1 MATE family efflux transporter [Actinoplanes sandaracinus]
METTDNRGPARQLTAVGLPLLIGAVSASLSGIIDTAMMGRYGTTDLAAVAGTAAVFDVFGNVAMASMIGYQILAPRFAGRQDPAGIRRALRATAWWCGGLTLLLTALCLSAGGWLAGLIAGGDAQVQAIGADYLTARAPAMVLLVPFALLTVSFNAYGETRWPATAGVLVNVVNLVLDAALIYGPGPLPRLGATGNGLATTLASAAGLAFLIVCARRQGLFRRLAERGPDRPPADFETSVPKLAWPAMVSTGLDYAILAVFFGVLAAIGTTALAGGRIAFELMVFLFGVGMAFAAAARILVGRAIGASDRHTAWLLWRAGRRILLGSGVLVGVLLLLAPRMAAGLFTSFPAVRDQTAAVLPLLAAALPLMGLTLANLSLIRALGHTRWDMYANLTAAAGIQLPIGWWCSSFAGLPGAFVGVFAYWLARAVFTGVICRRLTRGWRTTAAQPTTPGTEVETTR